MATKINYTSFNDLDFAGDTSFQEWVFRPTAESEIFWKNFIEQHPSQTEAIDKAVFLLKSILFKKEFPSNAQIERSLKKALLNINAHGANKKVGAVRHIVTMNRWWAAAAILLVLASISYVLVNNKEQKASPVLAAQAVKQDILPGGNRATLTLADGSSIVLDSAQNGSLAKQGNSQVVKLKDGKLAYQKENNAPATIQYNTISTPRGGQYQVALSDGSQVWLNAASSITFPTSFSGNTREVKITGEAYFEIAHNAKMPFRVTVNDMEVQVLGTHFNMNAYEDDGIVYTTLFKGSVRVVKGNESVIISPGEQAQVKFPSDKIAILKDVDLEPVTAWKNGKFIFQGEGIQSIMKQLGRWYDVYPDYQQQVTDEKFVGVISRNVNLSQILAMLERTGVVKFSIVGKNVIIKGTK